MCCLEGNCHQPPILLNVLNCVIGRHQSSHNSLWLNKRYSLCRLCDSSHCSMYTITRYVCSLKMYILSEYVACFPYNADLFYFIFIYQCIIHFIFHCKIFFWAYTWSFILRCTPSYTGQITLYFHIEHNFIHWQT